MAPFAGLDLHCSIHATQDCQSGAWSSSSAAMSEVSSDSGLRPGTFDIAILSDMGVIASQSPSHTQFEEETIQRRDASRQSHEHDHELHHVKGEWRQNVSAICTVTACSREEARRLLEVTKGDVQQAVLLAFESAKIKEENAIDGDQPNTPSTLLDDLLQACGGGKGDTLVVLDLKNLRACRLESAEVCLFSKLLEQSQGDEVNGIRNFLLLQKPDGVDDIPHLVRKNLYILRSDCEDESYCATGQDEPGAADWISSFTYFFGMTRSFRTTLHADIEEALPMIETIAQVVERYGKRGPLLTGAIGSLLMPYISGQRLWTAIAKEPARWLVIGWNLQSETVYEEAFIHVVGSFDLVDWPGGLCLDDLVKAIPKTAIHSIIAKAHDLEVRRARVERSLLMLQSKTTQLNETSRQVVRTTLQFFREWLSEHIGAINPSEELSGTHLSFHEVECRTPACFYRAISAGGDAYLSEEHVITQVRASGCFQQEPAVDQDIRQALRGAKKVIAQKVAPFLKSTLQYRDKDELPYLSCIQFEKWDVPWEQSEIKHEM